MLDFVTTDDYAILTIAKHHKSLTGLSDAEHSTNIPWRTTSDTENYPYKTHGNNHACRLTAMLILHRRDGVISVARMLCCARSSVGQWINWFTFYGTEVLVSLPYCSRIVSSHLFWKRSISLNNIPDALHSSSALGIAIRFSFLCDSRINRGGGLFIREPLLC